MFDICSTQAALEQHGNIARIVIAHFEGSSPREVGASMLVWEDGHSGTIGGGALEWLAIKRAREMLSKGGQRLDREALGPNLGQCCGGRVTLLTEVFTRETLPQPQGEIFARATQGGEMPLAVARVIANARAKGELPPAQLLQGWMIEPLSRPKRQLWIWGAGHVGRAMVATLAPLPDFQITWIDTDRARFPDDIPPEVTPIWTAQPAGLAPHAPRGAEHLIFTFSHALDLELCHQLLKRGDFGFLGLIGSATKWARFRSRLLDLGHSAAEAHKICCPIGQTSFGKHPQAIAIGVAHQLLSRNILNEMERPDDRRDDSRAFALGGPD